MRNLRTTDAMIRLIADVQAGGDDLKLGVIDETLDTIRTSLTKGTFVNVDHLAGVKELAELFNVERTTITGSGWAGGPNNFPEPVKRLGGGPVYDIGQVVRWWAAWTPRKGRKAGTLAPAVARLFGVKL